MKKFLSVILALVITHNMMAMSATVTIPEKTLLNYNFSGISEIPTGLTASEQPNSFEADHIAYSGRKSPKIVSDTINTNGAFEFSVETAISDNWLYLYAGTEKNLEGISKQGYTFEVKNVAGGTGSTIIYNLYRNGIKIAEEQSRIYEYYWGHQNKLKYTIKVTDSAIIAMDAKSGEVYNLVQEAPDFEGSFGVGYNYPNTIKLYSMSLIANRKVVEITEDITVPAENIISQSFAGLTELPYGWTASRNDYIFMPDGSIGYPGGSENVKFMYENGFDTDNKSYTLTFKIKTYDNLSSVAFGDYLMEFTVCRTGEFAYQKAEMILKKKNLEGVYEDISGIITDNQANHAYQHLRQFQIKVDTQSNTVEISGVAIPDERIIIEDESPSTSGELSFTLATSGIVASGIADVAIVREEYIIKAEEKESLSNAKYIIPGKELKKADFVANMAMPADWYTNAAESEYSYTVNGLRFNSYYNKTIASESIFESDIDYIAEAKYTLYNNQSNFNFATSQKGSAEALSGYRINISGGWNADKTVTLYKNGVSVGSAYTAVGKGTSAIATVKAIVTSSDISVYVNNNELIRYNDNQPIMSGYLSINNNNIADFTLGYISVSKAPVEKNANDYLIKKDFNADDTVASILIDGWTATGVSKFTDNGMCFNSSGKVYYTEASLSGNYTMEFNKTYKTYNNTYIYVAVNGNNYYRYSEKDGTWTISKYIDGIGKVLKTDKLHPNSSSSSYNTNFSVVSYKICVSNNETSVDVQFNVITERGTYTINMTDNGLDSEGNDIGTPLLSGGFGFGFEYANVDCRVGSICAYPTTEAGKPDLSGKYYINGLAVSKIVKGYTSFKMPTVLLGQKTFTAAVLYENGSVREFKIIDNDELKLGIVNLFDTSNEPYTNIKIKTFVWNSIDKMKPITNAFIIE